MQQSKLQMVHWVFCHVISRGMFSGKTKKALEGLRALHTEIHMSSHPELVSRVQSDVR